MNYSKIIHETDNFIVAIANPPHIDRLDGGHIVIISRNEYKSFDEMPVELAQEMIALGQRTGRLLKSILTGNGVEIGIVNYQINGNWSVLSLNKDPIHMHIYGRAVHATHQKFGEALHFPNPGTGFYDGFQPISELEANKIAEGLAR